jgi:hypothetical protein
VGNPYRNLDALPGFDDDCFDRIASIGVPFDALSSFRLGRNRFQLAG